jgi:hypothetical protein
VQRRKLGILFCICLAGLTVIGPSSVAAKRHYRGFGPRKFSLVQQSFNLSEADSNQRLVALCPGRSTPYGGAMYASPGPSATGEGVYPHSYERLGIQHGWHVSAVLFDPKPPATSRTVTVQVICGPWAGRMIAVHQTVFVGAGGSGDAIATCPRGTRIFSGGFQRTDFTSVGGNYVTSSRAISDTSWEVTGHAELRYGGEMTAIAYCMVSRRPLISEVAADAPSPLLPLGYQTATTPPCPPANQMVAGGFSMNGSTSSFFGNGSFNPDGTWSASGFSYFGGHTRLTAYAYCLPLALAHFAQHGDAKKIPHPKVVQAPPNLDAALHAAILARLRSSDGCYPVPDSLAAEIRQAGIPAAVTADLHGVGPAGTVYVLTNGAACDEALLATRSHRHVILLDSRSGNVTSH